MSDDRARPFRKPQATRPVCPRIAVVFDFDDTLGSDTFDDAVKSFGLDVASFRKERVEPLIREGWDGVAARFYSLIQESRQREKLTQARLASLGEKLQMFEGVEAMFSRLRQNARDCNPQTEIEFYLISGGLGDIIRSTSVAPFFKRLWASEFHYDAQGEVEFVKRAISHTEKTRYLMAITSGKDGVEEHGRSFAYRDVPEEELHVPLAQMVYVGDGASDIPCFSLVNDGGGICLGVFKERSAEKWSEKIQLTESQRVANLAPADYREGSELMRSLTLAVESICKRISLKQLGIGE